MNKLKEIIKIAAFDIDGTILPNGTTNFSQNIKNMFVELRKQNIISVVSTARDFATIGDFLEQLNPDYYIGANGSFIWDVQNKKIIYKVSLNKDEVIKIYNQFENEIEAFSITDFDKVFTSPNMQLNSWFVKPFVQNYHTYEEKLLSSEHLYMITIGSENTRELSDKVQKFIEDKNLNMEIASRWSRGFFISPKNITKSTTLNLLCKEVGLTMDNLIAFGDSSNDYEMIRDAFYGVAMERANNKIKLVAKDIAIDCEYDGSYLKLKELKLI
ncbi:YcsE-related riboflavin metabolism phosphatase [Mycoplasma leonicaptivi]|uniref:YcsE-related riboflavin metabolism phosphatase n=1 Tax=Mycoplasma leonicaptivi TaxID=36742 RepID=UPI00047F15AC|nr:HAD family hydrolase [Mycoplasma leonicaptivi]